MDTETLYSILKDYFSKNPDLMRHLHINACWEYNIYETSLNDNVPKLSYFLYKKDNDNLFITQQNPEINPDLILYFTESSILCLIQNNPNAETYYERYRNLRQKSSITQVDSKINKSRLNLLRIGYQKWQKDFKF